jgi:hypothetical protein
MTEQFHFLGRTYDISKALQIVEGREPSGTMDPAPWEQFISLTGSQKITMGITVDSQHMHTVDLSIPVIIAKITLPSGATSHFLLDGWHRVAKALACEVSGVPYYLLSTEELSEIS